MKKEVGNQLKFDGRGQQEKKKEKRTNERNLMNEIR
jgi:hypothetical protein